MSANLNPVGGVRLGAACAGIKQGGCDDIAIMELPEDAQTAAVFTRNAFCAAPVQIARRNLATVMPRYLLINSGNANAGTGQAGLKNAEKTCQMVAEASTLEPQQVLPFSTGVIGNPLPVHLFKDAIPKAIGNLSKDGWPAAAEAIMTTDTVPKGCSKNVKVDGKLITITGIAKGAGMIRPDMATMLAFIATDVGLTNDLLNRCLRQATRQSFNRISIDGDTSTNDACVLMATGASGVVLSDTQHANYRAFEHSLTQVFIELAQAIVRDGEGATKFISIQVREGVSEQECLQVAYCLAHSPLVKTAFFASDPNWGRLLAAVGRAGVEDLDIDRLRIRLGDVLIVENGGVAASYEESQGQRVMDQGDIEVFVDLGRGGSDATVWTSDLSYDYVKINAEYRT